MPRMYNFLFTLTYTYLARYMYRGVYFPRQESEIGPNISLGNCYYLAIDASAAIGQ